VNTIDTLRRLLSILNLLKLSPLALHAGIQQRQRLKNLDRLVVKLIVKAQQLAALFKLADC
jgi:ATP-dependent RNA helicase DDX24/MAK5